MRIPILVLLVLCAGLKAVAKVQLPSIFTDNMVLQQQSAVAIWGHANPNATMHIITGWDKKNYTLHVPASGKWTLKIQTPKAGGPYTLTFNDGSLLNLRNILIGEVWFCSGQSNMEMALKGNSSPVLNAGEIILAADNPSLRLYRVGRAANIAPAADLKGRWVESTSETARDFSALAFQYGQFLQKKLKVPIGIILSSAGGTMIEAWMSRNSLNDFPEVKIPECLDPAQAVHKEPTVLYNGMIAPVAGYGIKGFLWLQGESNRHEPELYEKLFPAMVADWRKIWKLGEIPFYYVQIAPYGGTDKTRNGPGLREAQLKASKIIPNCGMVCTLDIGMETDIHFMDKTTPALRAAYWALGKTYGIKGINYHSPELKTMQIEGNAAILSFDYAPYLTSYRKPLTLFEIAGQDRKFYPAKAIIKANQITLSSNDVPQPIAVRYAYKEWVKAELFNNDGLPASSFRTDNW